MRSSCRRSRRRPALLLRGYDMSQQAHTYRLPSKKRDKFRGNMIHYDHLRFKEDLQVASKVYWADLQADYRENLPQKLTRLMKTAGMEPDRL